MVTFVDLRLRDAVVDDLERLRITSPKELALLAALLIEVPIGDDVGDINRQHLNRVLDYSGPRNLDSERGRLEVVD